MKFLIIWLLFGIVCAAIGSNKGRSRFGWFLMGGLLGLFGLILAFVVGKNVDAVEKQASALTKSKNVLTVQS